MSFKPLVSIIVNCYNGSKYLEEALRSLKNQTYDNFEVIFWDNQSTDDSKKIFDKNFDKRFKYYYASEHTTLYEARNMAINKCKGDFISFLDTDDLWEYNKLEMQVPLFFNSEIAVVYSNFWLMKNSKKNMKIFSKKKLHNGYIYEKLINYYNVGILTVIIRKKVFESLNKKFDKRFSIIGDFDLILRLAKKHKFSSIDKPLAYYRLHAQNFSSTNKNKKFQETELWINENEDEMTEKMLSKIKNKLNYEKFMNSKINKDLKNCYLLIKNMKLDINLVKSIFIFFIPVFLIKKIFWFD